MKRLFRFVAACCLAISMLTLLAGCGAGTDKPKPQKVIKIGVDAEFPPFSYKNSEGKLVGLDIELAQEAAKRSNTKVEFVPMAWYAKEDLLNKGEIDCIWSCYSIDGREDRYSWTKPYMQSGQYAVVRADSDILRLRDLQGKTVAAQATTKFLEEINKGTIKPGKVLVFSSAKECFDAVISGKADATGGHLAVMMTEVKSDVAKSNLEVLLYQPLTRNKIGVAFKKGNTEQAEELNQVLHAMYKDGTMERIAAKYYLSKDVLMYE